MSKAEILENAMTELDGKYIDEAAEELYKRQGTEIKITERQTAKPRKTSGFRTFLGIAAAAAIVAGCIFALKALAGKPIISENPLDSSLMDRVTKYDRMVISADGGMFTEIYTDIWDDYTVLAAELVQCLEETPLTATEYIPVSNGGVGYYSVSLYSGDVCDKYIITPCSTIENPNATIITKNCENFEASGDKPERIYEICHKLIFKTGVPAIAPGEYYLDGDYESGVLIAVLNGEIGIWGDNAYDFVKENCGEQNPDEVYKALSLKKYVISSIEMENHDKPIITEWDKNKKVNANQYEGTSYYYHSGSNMESDIIILFDHKFTLKPLENIEYKEEFDKGVIEFTDLKAADVLSNTELGLQYYIHEDGVSLFERISGGKGIELLSESVISDYRFDYYLDWNSLMTDSVLPSERVSMKYRKNDGSGSYFTVFAGQEGHGVPRIMMGNGMGLCFWDENGIKSVFNLDDGTTLEMKIGGVVFDGIEYYYAEWTDEKRKVNYSVSGIDCTRDDFIEVVIAIVYNICGGTTGFGWVPSTASPVDFSAYEMDFQIFHEYFNAVWLSDAGNDIEITLNDRMFSYDVPLLGFYKDEKGAYMAKQFIHTGEYVVYFVSEDDRNTLHQYLAKNNADGTYSISEQPDASLPKKSAGMPSKHAGMFGYIGLYELCQNTGLDFDLLHNLSFTDHNGVRWERSFNIGDLTCVTGVINYGGDGNPIKLALQFINAEDREERQYFACTFEYKNGEYQLAEFPNEPFRFDISVLDYENSQTAHAESIRQDIDAVTANGVTGCYLAADFYTYRVSEECYYLIRQMGMNQAQWLGYVDIFYYNGSEYIHVDEEYNSILGSCYWCYSDGYLYYLSRIYEGNKYYISCIKDGVELSCFEMGDIGNWYIPRYISVSDSANREVTVGFTESLSGHEIAQTIGFATPKSPSYSTSEIIKSPETAVSDGYRYVDDVGVKQEKRGDYIVTGKPYLGDNIHLIEASQAEKLILMPYSTLIFTISENNDFKHNNSSEAWFSFSVNVEEESSVSVGAISGDNIYQIYNGAVYKEGGFSNFSLVDTLPDGEYRFFITNMSEDIQYYDFIGIAVT